jgi:hypothetical protein
MQNLFSHQEKSRRRQHMHCFVKALCVRQDVCYDIQEINVKVQVKKAAQKRLLVFK